MTKSIFIFDVDSPFFTTKIVVADIESFACNIGGSLHDLESLPADLWLFVILAMRKMIERCEFFTIEDMRLLPP